MPRSITVGGEKFLRVKKYCTKLKILFQRCYTLDNPKIDVLPMPRFFAGNLHSNEKKS